MAKKNIQDVRVDYQLSTLNDPDVPESPFELFATWMKEAADQVDKDHNAMVVSTMGTDGPDSRVLLLKGYDEKGLVFFSSYASKKGRDIEHNERVAINFFWPSLERQIRVQGVVQLLEEERSIEYFASRPRNSQLGAWASQQSEIISSRADLEKKFGEVETRFEGKAVPKPEAWGGYLVVPTKMEFWQGRSGRLHDRIQFELVERAWLRSRLQP